MNPLYSLNMPLYEERTLQTHIYFSLTKAVHIYINTYSLSHPPLSLSLCLETFHLKRSNFLKEVNIFGRK